VLLPSGGEIPLASGISSRSGDMHDSGSAASVTGVIPPVADGFTKALSLQKFTSFQHNLNLGRLRLRGNVRDTTHNMA
jgi:hypothetical protein